MSRDPSRWWYALVPFPVLVGLRYALVWLTELALPTAGPTRSEALPVLLLGLAASLVGALVVIAAPLFLGGLLLDIRTLRTRSAWTPHWGYGLLGAIPVAGLVLVWPALLSIPAALTYLERRRRMVGHPFGDGRTAEPSSKATADARARTTPWVYGIVVPPALEVAGAVLAWGVLSTGLLQQGAAPLSLLVPIATSLVAVGLVPLFAVCLYLDATEVRDASEAATPRPLVWGLLGLGSLVGLAFFRVTLMPFVALVYWFRYRKNLGI